MTAKPRRATYRHGNLREAALKAASRLVAKGGHEALSLREVAEAVGVAHRSLYNHFAHREALLDAVATDAYLRLAAKVSKAKTAEDYTAAYVGFALKNRIPVLYGSMEFVQWGGLMSYGPNYPEMFRIGADYVDRILKGAKPGDLPIEQPTRFEFALNLKTAKALGLTIPQSVLLRADRVIE